MTFVAFDCLEPFFAPSLGSMVSWAPAKLAMPPPPLPPPSPPSPPVPAYALPPVAARGSVAAGASFTGCRRHRQVVRFGPRPGWP